VSKKKKIDKKRRRFLLRATSAMGILGLTAAGVPFASAMWPSEEAKARGAPIKVSLEGMKPGDQITVVWRGRPIWIIYRTPEMLVELPKLDNLLSDPESKVEQQPQYADNEFRSIKPKFLVLVGVCTHLGCVPTYRPEPKSVDENWEGGFYCTCHGSKFDLAGRVYKGVPAPINLEVPPYRFLSETEILIGEDQA